MSDPHSPSRLSITVKTKESARYANDSTWCVFHGSPEQIREDINATFGLQGGDDCTLFDLALQAQSIASGTANVARTLGGKTETPAASAAWEEARKQQANGEPASEPEVSEEDKMLARIGETEDVPALRDLFARNAELFNGNADLKAAWNARGLELQAKVQKEASA